MSACSIFACSYITASQMLSLANCSPFIQIYLFNHCFFHSLSNISTLDGLFICFKIVLIIDFVSNKSILPFVAWDTLFVTLRYQHERVVRWKFGSTTTETFFLWTSWSRTKLLKMEDIRETRFDCILPIILSLLRYSFWGT